MTSKKAWITKGMNEAQNTKNRPEQILAKNLIIQHMPRHTNFIIKTEYVVNDLKPEPEVWLVGNRSPKLDIAVVLKDDNKKIFRKIAIRLNGPPHDAERQNRYDDMQEGILAKNDWFVVNFKYDKMPALWGDAPKTYVKTAYMEVKETLAGVLNLVDYP